MILNVLIHKKMHYAETWPEMSALITEATEGLAPERTVTVGGRELYYAGEKAEFSFSERRHAGGSDLPNNALIVAVNTNTDYGALMWFVTSSSPLKGEIYDHTWVTDNPNPPGFDPRVVANPYDAHFHDPRNTLPVPEIRSALEEYCRTGTGDRPESLRWIKGDLTGQRLEQP